MTPRIFDTCMFNNELDVLEARLYELQDIPNLTHVMVEADVDHQDHPKPFVLSENLDRFDQWRDRLIVVQAKGLPTAAEDPDAWSREHAQREWVAEGLRAAGCENDDIVLHGDVDEIPTAVAARNVRPRGYVAFDMACFSMAVDWMHPERWRGTVASLARNLRTFSAMRDARNFAPSLPNAGWHLGWLGGREAALAKLGSFCHPEIEARTRKGLEADWFLREGWHVDGKKLIPVDVDGSWPRWITEGRCPQSWFRPRPHVQPDRFGEQWFGEASQRALIDLYQRVAGLDGDIIEVGSWTGRSTVALANACAPATLHAVDTWAGSPGEVSSELAGLRDVYAQFRRNINDLTSGNVEVHRMGWRNFFAGRTEPVRFCFIDAEHSYTEVRDNIAAVLPLIVPGGIICGDDNHHRPVQEAVVDALGDAHVSATLWWWQAPDSKVDADGDCLREHSV